jgi:hypothetical protein
MFYTKYALLMFFSDIRRSRHRSSSIGPCSIATGAEGSHYLFRESRGIKIEALDSDLDDENRQAQNNSIWAKYHALRRHGKTVKPFQIPFVHPHHSFGNIPLTLT